MKKIFIITILSALVFAQTCYADRGGIPFEENVQIFEPTQRAMIAWDGKEEILLLTTDLYASKATKILEILPLRSEPAVKKGEVETFKKAIDLINTKLAARRKLERSLSKNEASLGEQAMQPAGEVTFHEKIGAHDVTTTHVLDTNGFIDWVTKYLKSAGVDNPVIPENIKAIVNSYISDGFLWFVFDVVSLDESPKTNEAIQYRFATEELFYPMRISSTAKGSTSIELLILTPKLLSNFTGISVYSIDLRHYPVDISSKELQELNKDMDDLLGHRDDMQLRIWRISGELSSFTKDLVAKEK